MYRLRSVRHSDLEPLYHLSGLSMLLNLPNDRARLLDLIDRSIKSFAGEYEDPQEAVYTFVLETPDDQVIGTSAIKAQMGTRDDPNVSFEVLTIEKYFKGIDRLFRHRALKLSFNYEGPTEIASIIMDPAFRGKGRKLGRQLSFVRFLYMAAQRERFREKVLAEMLPPHVSEGWSPLWDALGHKFTGLSYVEADRMSKQNKSFIEKLFPHEAIYVTLLPDEAQKMVGAVAEQTVPAVKLLESVGFRYYEHVDPFDGGPHYHADRDQILLIRHATSGSVHTGKPDPDAPAHLVGVESEAGVFTAVLAPVEIDGERIVCSSDVLERLGCDEGTGATATPITPES